VMEEPRLPRFFDRWRYKGISLSTMKTLSRTSWIITLLVACAFSALAGEGTLLVVCAPGYPGNTEQAQSTLDDFASAAAAAAGWDAGALLAEYHEKAQAGLERIGSDEAALALVTLPFYLEYGSALGLRPHLAGVQEGSSTESWSLAVPKGSISGPAGLAGWELTGVPAFSPSLVRGPLLSGWGKLPGDVKITFTSRTLSALRRASTGEKVAVLLDPVQAGALSSLPFGGKIEIVARSPEVPASLLCTVAGRLPAGRTSILDAFSSMHENETGAAALEAIRLERFVPVDGERLEAVRTAFEAAGGAADPR